MIDLRMQDWEYVREESPGLQCTKPSDIENNLWHDAF